MDNLDIVRAYLKALGEGKTGGEIAALFDDDIDQIEHPNRIKPKGDRRGRASMTAASKQGAKILQRQSYTILNALANDDRVAVEVLWEGVLAIPMGNLKAGEIMRVHSGMFFTFRDGKIVRHVNYDCVEEF